MGDLRGTTTTGADAVIKEAVVAELRGSLRGEMLCPSDAGTLKPARSGTPCATSDPRLSCAAPASPTSSLLSISPAHRVFPWRCEAEVTTSRGVGRAMAASCLTCFRGRRHCGRPAPDGQRDQKC